MNFDNSEKLQEKLKNNVGEMKKVKAKTNQTKYTKLVRLQGDLLDQLFEEMDSLKNSFEMFKLHTLSTFEQEKQSQISTKCVTTPFQIYVQQK
tara:strand:- start:202 stop:480 length:279 start_codon:yes stop_codon:yes gene_type:complete